jgi:hypothetical protein
MTVQSYTLQIGVSDSMIGGDIIEINMRHIDVYQMYLIIGALEKMLTRFKQTTEPYYAIIMGTINTMNILLSEVEGNSVFCTLSQNMKCPHADAVAEEFIGSLDEDTMDITIDSETPTHEFDSESLEPFLHTINNRRIFSYAIQSTIEPPWTEVLRVLEWSA